MVQIHSPRPFILFSSNRETEFSWILLGRSQLRRRTVRRVRRIPVRIGRVITAL